MKKIQLTLAVVLLFLSGCGNSISSDAQKVADILCKAEESKQKSLLIETANYISEANNLAQEMMNSKYVSMEQKQEFQKALMEAFANCNN